MVSAKNKHVDQWNSAEVSPHTYGELIFDKSGKNIQGLLSLQQMVLGKLDSCIESKKLDHTFTPYTEVNDKWLEYLNIRHSTINLLEENKAKHSLM